MPASSSAALPLLGGIYSVAAQEFAYLAPSMLSPGAAIVQLVIRLPVPQRLPPQPLAFIRKGQVVVSVGITGRQRNGLSVSGNRLIRPLKFVQHIAQIEKGQHVP